MIKVRVNNINRLFSLRRWLSQDSAQRPNYGVVQMLVAHKAVEDQQPRHRRNAFKIRAFQSAIDVIEQLPEPIQSLDQLRGLKGVGSGITRRIAEYLKLEDGVDAVDESLRPILEELETIPSIGPKSALALVKSGCTSVKDLHLPQFQEMLTARQKIGLKYARQLDMRVTRTEAESVVQFIRDNISSKYELVLCGNFRRGLPTDRSLCLLLFHPSHIHVPPPASHAPTPKRHTAAATQLSAYVSKAERASSLLMNDAIPVLEKRGLVAERFSVSPRKWSGIVRVPRRRKGDGADGWEVGSVRKQAIKDVEGRFVMCEINMIPSCSRGTALLTLTGDAEFNRYLRTRAYLRGERHLDMYGLWRARSHGEKIQWELIDAPSEEDVFRDLEMPFVDPSQRGFLKKELKRRVLKSIEGEDGGESDTRLEEVP